MPIYRIYFENGEIEEKFFMNRKSLEQCIKNQKVKKVINLNKPVVTKSKRNEYRDWEE